MSRKDYETITKAIASIPRTSPDSEAMRATIAGNLAVALQRDNPRFDQLRFMKACNTVINF